MTSLTSMRLVLFLSAFGVLSCGGGAPSAETLDAQTVDSPDQADGTGSDLAADSDLTADVPAPQVCIPSTTRCVRGVRQVCDATGTKIAYESCPAGMVCVGSGCVPNSSEVHIVVTGPGSALFALPTDEQLLQAVFDDMCLQNEACCKSDWCASGCNQDRTWPISKYWVRRLARDLDSEQGIRFSLIRPLSIEAGSPTAACLSHGSTPTPLDVNCQHGQYRVLEDAEATTLLPAGPRWTPQSLLAPGVAERADDALKYFLSAAPGATAEEVLSWVDEREVLLETGSGCQEDPDCAGGFCREGRCLVHTNPEIAFLDGYGTKPGLLLAYYTMGIAARAQGRSCKGPADCGDAAYACTKDGTCDDPARLCRRHHVVLISDFAGVPPLWRTPCSWEPAPIDEFNVARWLRWGCACDADPDCSYGAACDILAHQCRPKEPPAGGGDFAILDPVCNGLPPGFARDRNGDRIDATVHAILTNETDPGSFFDEQQVLATNVAFHGGGVAVTPCSGALYPNGLPLDGSCDFEAQYGRLLDAIRSDLDTFVCTPGSVGL